ncbi:hypothetical protein [Treponema putidum]|uniref:Uncharacterized protein n=1 Tax=Treponema putidum TaxID=221027 RepID=A0ABY5HZ43_9SPIR|nr:hypothetical protein [Treponema putidum]UTY29804.1 hypothetical protein E4N76_13160 [Treponema putidum]
MQTNIDLSKKIAIEFDLEEAFQILLAMTDVMSTTDCQGLQANTIGFYMIAIDNIIKTIQKQVIG